MNTRVRVNGSADGAIAPGDRGLCYGDGLFETVLMVHGRAPLWPRHMKRLAGGCQRLGLPPPDADVLWHEACATSAGLARAVVRITLTRGVGARGYAPPVSPETTRVVQAGPAPVLDADWSAQGIRVRFCNTRLGLQPLLAGIKHLNRLEQVLARAEAGAAAWDEGLMRDIDGRVVCATSANLFALIDGRLHTPALTRCGVAGVARAEILAWHGGVVVADIDTETLMRADEIFLSSSVRGVVPVRLLDNQAYVAGAVTRAAQQHWQRLGLAAEACA